MRRLVFGGLVAAFAGTFVFACTLDLDESLIGKGARDGGGITIGDANLPDGTVISESGVPITPDGTCAKDSDCVSANGCLMGKCDLTRKACAYDVCHATACSVGVCDPAAKTCSQPQTYKEKAGELTLDHVTTNGIIAAYPWLFQMTSTGVLVYDVSNPTKSKPAAVPLVGLGFLPSQFTRSGNRIWIGAPLQGSPARLPVAYIDVPADPFTAKIEAHTILANYSRPASESVNFLASEGKNAIVYGPGPTYPSAVLDTLLAEPATKTATPVGAKDNTALTAVSGSRFVMIGQQPLTHQLTNQFALISGVGTTTPTAGELVTVGDMAAPTTGTRTWAQTLDGTLFFAMSVNGPGPEMDTTVTAAARGYILTKDGKSGIDGAAKTIALETYASGNAPGPNAEVVRGPTMLDADTFAVPVAAAENPSTTAIQFVKRDNTVVKDKRIVLPIALGNIAGTSASDGFVYVAVNIPSDQPDVPPTAKVYVIDAACAP